MMQHDDPHWRTRLQRALDALPVPARTVFTLHAWDDLPLSAIAARTGLSLGQVEVHLAAALVHLDRQIGASVTDAAVTSDSDRR